MFRYFKRIYRSKYRNTVSYFYSVFCCVVIFTFSWFTVLPDYIISHWNPDYIISHWNPDYIISHWNPDYIISHWNPDYIISHWNPDYIISHWNPAPSFGILSVAAVPILLFFETLRYDATTTTPVYLQSRTNSSLHDVWSRARLESYHTVFK